MVMYEFRFAIAPGITWSAPDPWPPFDPVGQFWQLYDSAPFVVAVELSPIIISPKAIVLLVPSVMEASLTGVAEPFAGR